MPGQRGLQKLFSFELYILKLDSSSTYVTFSHIFDKFESAADFGFRPRYKFESAQVSDSSQVR